MDCREASGFILFIRLPLSLPCSLFILYWVDICFYQWGRCLWSVEGKDKTVLCRWQKDCVKHSADELINFHFVVIRLFIWLHSCDLERLIPQCSEGWVQRSAWTSAWTQLLKKQGGDTVFYYGYVPGCTECFFRHEVLAWGFIFYQN